jgi:hypothetical protein
LICCPATDVVTVVTMKRSPFVFFLVESKRVDR